MDPLENRKNYYAPLIDKAAMQYMYADNFITHANGLGVTVQQNDASPFISHGPTQGTPQNIPGISRIGPAPATSQPPTSTINKVATPAILSPIDNIIIGTAAPANSGTGPVASTATSTDTNINNIPRVVGQPAVAQTPMPAPSTTQSSPLLLIGLGLLAVTGVLLLVLGHKKVAVAAGDAVGA